MNYVATFEKPYFTTNHSNVAVVTLKEKGLVNTRVNGIQVEVVALELGKQIIANQIEHEIVTNQESSPMPMAKDASQFVIEDDVPMPKIKRNRTKKPIAYPLEQMQVGQSFFVPAGAKTKDLTKLYRNVSVLVSQAKRNLGLDIKFRIAVDFECNGVRVWRRQ
ncbi:hypothetical protein [Haemophilus influenzae]|uniref:DUF7303 family protein n=1 Tax=Haemophilus influenzae TaxID=727 RepID=UPI003BFA777C